MWEAIGNLFQGPQPMEENPEPPKPEPVFLNVYDLDTRTAELNGAVLNQVGTGAYHAGVEVFGIEYSFGRCPDPNVTGVYGLPPKGCQAHPFRESLPMGETTLTKKEVREVIRRLCMQWMSEDYDILRRNCCHFSCALCEELGVGPVPSWVTNLAGVGAVLRSSARLVVKAGVGAPFYAVQGAMVGMEKIGEAMGGDICLHGVPEKSKPLVRQLVDLGFSKQTAIEAAKRSSSIEAAMDWITTNQQ